MPLPIDSKAGPGRSIPALRRSHGLPERLRLEDAIVSKRAGDTWLHGRMIDGARVRESWPLFRRAAWQHHSDARLLLALAWERSGLEPSMPGGLLRMSDRTAQYIAHHLGVPRWDLRDRQTAVNFGAFQLGVHLGRFIVPRVAVAACIAGSAAVEAAHDQIPPFPHLHRIVRDVFFTWRFLVGYLDKVLRIEGLDLPRQEVPTASSALVLPSSTVVTANANVAMLDPGWQVLAGEGGPLSVSSALVAGLEQMAASLGLVVIRDDEQHQLYLALARSMPIRPSSRLILPVPGARPTDDGSFMGGRTLDIVTPFGSPVRAAANGTLVEPDTPRGVLTRLDRPVMHERHPCRYAWYGSMSRLRYGVGKHVVQGELIGWSGLSRRLPLLEFGVWGDPAATHYIPPVTVAAMIGWNGGDGYGG